jgi:hypothetical protein
MAEGENDVSFSPDDSGELIKFHKAYNHHGSDARVKWRVAICKEFENMKNKIPKGRICVKNKWVSKIKNNKIFRARFVACGYSQVPGIDFTESYSQVIYNLSFRIILIGMMVWNLNAKIIDFETAFLQGD